LTDLILVRHGQASFGTDDYDRLSELGHQQAVWIGAYFRECELTFDHVIEGDLLRHRETREGIARAYPPMTAQVDPRFREFDYDSLLTSYLTQTGHTRPTCREDFLDLLPAMFTHWQAGDAGDHLESYDHFSNRVNEAAQSACSHGSKVLIVTSGGVIGALISRILDLSPENTAKLMLSIHNASIHRFTFEQGALRLAQFNGMAHLEGTDRRHAWTYV